MTSLYTLIVQLRWASLPLVIFLLGCATEPLYEPPPELDDLSTETQTAKFAAKKSAAVRVKPSYPEKYTVQKDDTLWDIAAQFLEDPWVWPAIWDVNPQIENPHLIYPGDIIRLIYVDGEPRLVAERESDSGRIALIVGQSSSGAPIDKLSPRIRIEPLDLAIPSIPADAIEQFTVNPRVLTREKLEAAAYVIGNFDNRLISASGNQVYVRGIVDDGEALYSIFRPGKVLINPENGELLGYEVAFVGDAKVLEYGDPTTVLITRSKREALNGDVLLPLNRGRISYNYIPNVPELEINGTIISLFDALSHAAQNQVIVINLGQRDGMERGDILGIKKFGGIIRDVYGKKSEEVVILPDTRIGIAMIFKVFDRVSYGLIMESTRAVQVGDIIANP